MKFKRFKLRKSFYISFISSYLLLSFYCGAAARISWVKKPSPFENFLERAETVITEGFFRLFIISFILAIIANFISKILEFYDL